MSDQGKEQSSEDRVVVVKATWAKTVERIGLRLITVGGLVLVLLSIPFVMTKCASVPVELTSKAGESAIEFVKAFQSGKVTTEFRSHFTNWQGSNRLQVGELEEIESFSKVSSKTVFFDTIALPDVEVEIEAPATFTFYLDLQKEWDISWNETEGEVRVNAPSINWNKPAIDLSRMKVRQEDSYLRFGEDTVRNELQASLSEMAQERAAQKIVFIRELARKETAQFVRTWLLERWLKDSDVKPHIEVVFADELEEVPAQTDSVSTAGTQ